MLIYVIFIHVIHKNYKNIDEGPPDPDRSVGPVKSSVEEK